MNRQERRRRQREERRPIPPTGRRLAEGDLGWSASGDGRTVVGVCDCGQPAVVDCPVCGPQCARCFTEAGRPF